VTIISLWLPGFPGAHCTRGAFSGVPVCHPDPEVIPLAGFSGIFVSHRIGIERGIHAHHAEAGRSPNGVTHGIAPIMRMEQLPVCIVRSLFLPNRKLGVTSRTEAVIAAQKLDLLQDRQ
jgi:hypothetical protein